MKSLRRGDWIAYYSPRERIGDGAAVQAFTTIGQITSHAPYRAAQAMDFNPYRVDVAYLMAARAAPIRPLLQILDLTRDRGPHWGNVMRGPKRRLSATDMGLIARAMGVGPAFEQIHAATGATGVQHGDPFAAL